MRRRVTARAIGALLVVGVVSAGQPAAAAPGSVASAATWTCPVENRTTRPNNGGAAVATFPIKGIDISHWNTVSMSAVKAAGKAFVYLKATQGTSYTDPTYNSRQAAARKAHLLVGPYHMFNYRQDGKLQAAYFVKQVRARGGFSGRLRPVVDVECLTAVGPPDRARARVRLRAFVDEVRRLVGVHPIIYTSIFEWNTVTGGDATFGASPLWSAEWAKTAPLKFPPGWTNWTFWQYGPTVVPGASSRLDGDVFRGWYVNLKRYLVP
jgi:lysozyme